MRRRLSGSVSSMDRILDRKLAASGKKLEVERARLEASSPMKRLENGYGYLIDEEGKRIRSASDISEGKNMTVYLRDGSLKTRVEERRLK